ncbi:MAG: Grx4 family monothiol glutaredoxin [Bdellovibrionales bacterium]|nr:Grx4 family monothiol glutaredoxin [Bdellovibrionales bacterium]
MAHPLVPKVEEKVKSSKVVIFMKGTPQFPQCGFSSRAVQVLKAAGATDVVGVDVLADDPLWDALEDFTKWPTVPQIFINGQFVGGCDIVTEMFERGELQEALKA